MGIETCTTNNGVDIGSCIDEIDWINKIKILKSKNFIEISKSKF